MTGTTTTPTTGATAPPPPQFASRQATFQVYGQRGYGQSQSFTNNPPKIESFARGYPSLSALISSDKDFTLFRCFSRLHTRVLLHKQDELAELEQKLDQLDLADSQVQAYHLMTNRHPNGDIQRRALLKEIEEKLKEYNTLLESFLAHLERPEPEESQIRSVTSWMKGNKPLFYSESTFLNDWSDLRRARQSVEKGGLETFIAGCLHCPSLRRIYEFLSLVDSSSKSDDPRVKFLNSSKLVAISRALTTILAVATLVVPIGVLYCVEPIPERLGIIACFTIIFSSALCWLTSSRNYEIFSATAAYCAVMVVFVGSLPGS